MNTSMTILDDSRFSLPSASRMERIFACEGSFSAEEIASQQEFAGAGSADAQKGTMLHRAVELGDVSDLDDENSTLVETIRATEERLVMEWLAETGHSMDAVTIYRECRLWVEGLFSAQLDTLVVNNANRTAFCMDSKTGRKQVAPPVRNHQLRAQALAAYVNHGVFPIRTAIVQPLAVKHSVCEYSEDNLKVLMGIFKLKLERVRAPGLPRTAGTHCTFCKALPTCKEAHRNMSVAIRAVNLRWDLSTQEDKLRLYKAATIAKECSEQIIGLCRADLTADPDSIKGLVKARDSHPRSIKDLPAVVASFIADAQTYENEEILWAFIECSKLSVGALESLLMEKRGMSKKDAKDWIAAHPALIVEGTRSGKIEVVEEDLAPVNVAQGELANALPKGTTVVRA